MGHVPCSLYRRKPWIYREQPLSSWEAKSHDCCVGVCGMAEKPHCYNIWCNLMGILPFWEFLLSSCISFTFEMSRFWCLMYCNTLNIRTNWLQNMELLELSSLLSGCPCLLSVRAGYTANWPLQYLARYYTLLLLTKNGYTCTIKLPWVEVYLIANLQLYCNSIVEFNNTHFIHSHILQTHCCMKEGNYQPLKAQGSSERINKRFSLIPGQFHMHNL